MKSVLVLTDNVIIFEKFKAICEKHNRVDVKFDYFCSPSSEHLFLKHNDVCVLDIQKNYKSVIDTYSLVISCHCKKIFPAELVNSIRCINIHPGLNPYNRGWYPQVFAINNGLPHGATIHEMDEDIDHGAIIAQKNVQVNLEDTSLTVYERVLNAEIDLFDNFFNSLIDQSYVAHPMVNEGNYNSIQDFRNINHIDLDRKGTFSEFYNLLRSLTHGDHKNAYILSEDGAKIFISLNIEKN
ncbi:dTDP-4-amino-4,6-dideoxyglucose formyltransferase [Glaciecola sp. MH2013]|uniref:dTDP-4-amino-4,6-dideoxyglucose formyltransferase n=1 Tax=Glaciecola sp. MH2013 TaxID=2785524 RepID=UPI00189F3E57|nr:dTDP-4-amino-4,6-dideoxyglucose formyltransferase [Glaciecola sp. MH2013]MBF7072229.1 dTDP-4-amino-4,6-dideoxyglucose formyltransferase [Glaciecola sp. MH2013]